MDEAIVIQLVVRAVFGSIVAAIAHSRGRNAVGWFFIGSLIACLGLILVLVLPDLHADEQKRDRLRRDNVRLRERLNKERQVSDQRYAETARRLGAHDAVLGIETAPDDAAAPPQLPAQKSANISATARADEQWHYAVDDNAGTEGPVAFGDLQELWRTNKINGQSLVWKKDMGDWSRIDELPELREGHFPWLSRRRSCAVDAGSGNPAEPPAGVHRRLHPWGPHRGEDAALRLVSRASSRAALAIAARSNAPQRRSPARGTAPADLEIEGGRFSLLFEEVAVSRRAPH